MRIFNLNLSLQNKKLHYLVPFPPLFALIAEKVEEKI